jgi:predicted adenylyl cyclase CyaB
MPNIEIKARYNNLSKGRQIADGLKTKYIGVIRQIDTYFNTAQGRLKLREIPGQGAWLIPYVKTYEKRPAKSDYQLLEVKDAEAIKSLFSILLGTRFVVDKTREVFLIDNVRVHLDEVKGLGHFLEFEAVYDIDTPEVRDRESRKVAELMSTFGIDAADLVTTGYVDLLEHQHSGESAPAPL